MHSLDVQALDIVQFSRVIRGAERAREIGSECDSVSLEPRIRGRNRLSMARRILVRMLAAFFALACTALSAHAQYPERPLKIIVAWPPGGVVDTTARIIGEQLAIQFGQPVVVENRVGANGNIGDDGGRASARRRIYAASGDGRDARDKPPPV